LFRFMFLSTPAFQARRILFFESWLGFGSFARGGLLEKSSLDEHARTLEDKRNNSACI